ncbi:hypothetical protein TanjilG_01414 [Lupinus angustifolius]|nr:hypothetical protein TanjilG_01414 [Lupinus angustifolius]
MNNGEEGSEGTSRRIQVRFITKLDAPFKVPPTVIAIPADLSRFGLSSVVNGLLQAADADHEAEPFDFLIDGELVRMSLQQFLLAKGISAERILEIEYARVVAPRKEEDPSLHDDWVSAVDGSSSRFFLTGCYDGLGRVWKSAGLCTHILEGHSDAVTSVSIINPEDVETVTLATASKDRTLRLWKLNIDEDTNYSTKIRAFKILRGHKASVQSVAAQTSGEMVCASFLPIFGLSTLNLSLGSRWWQIAPLPRQSGTLSYENVSYATLFGGSQHGLICGENHGFSGPVAAVTGMITHKRKPVCLQSGHDMPRTKVCSGSWDSTINLWKTDDFSTEDDQVSKKRNVGGHAEESQLEGAAFTTLVGHTQCVSSVLWPQRDSIYSASWDHSIRKWDVETGKNLSDIFCGKALNCLDIGGEASALIAAGGSDPVIRIWDPRKPGSSAPVFQFASHTSWISACKWHATSSFHLLSASYDGKVMLWDLRTAWPLSVIESHSDKVLCADWWKGNSVISGGADSKLCISSQIPVQ